MTLLDEADVVNQIAFNEKYNSLDEEVQAQLQKKLFDCL